MKFTTRYFKYELIAITAALALVGCSHYRGGTDQGSYSGGMGSQSVTNLDEGSSLNQRDQYQDENWIPPARGDSEPYTPTPQDNNPQ